MKPDAIVFDSANSSHFRKKYLKIFKQQRTNFFASNYSQINVQTKKVRDTLIICLVAFKIIEKIEKYIFHKQHPVGQL